MLMLHATTAKEMMCLFILIDSFLVVFHKYKVFFIDINEYISSFSNGHKGGLRLDYLPCVNYSMLINKVNTCTMCEVENHDSVSWQALKVAVSGELIKPCQQYIDFVEAGQRVQIPELTIEPTIDKLLNMTEMVDTLFTITITAGDEELLVHDFPVSLMAFDQWTGIGVRPELLASFVVPNHSLPNR